MTIIAKLDDPDDIWEMEQTFKLIVEYLDNRRREMMYNDRLQTGAGSAPYIQELEANRSRFKYVADEIWKTKFPEWVRNMMITDLL